MQTFYRCFLLWTVIPFLCLHTSLWAQAASAASASTPYAAEPIVVTNLNIVIDMKADGTGTRTQSMIAKIQSEAALRTASVISVPFASATQRVEFIYLHVRHPDNTVTETPLENVQEEPTQVTREAPFYSDLREKQLPVKGLRVGDTLEWKIRVTVFKPETPNQFWEAVTFLRNGIVLNESVELRIPETVHAIVWTNPKIDVKPKNSSTGGDHIYNWMWKSLTPTVGPEAEAAAKIKKTKLLSADEELDQTQGSLPDVAWTTFPDWASVGAWYRALEIDKIQPDDTIKAKVAEIVAGKATEEDKVRAVYAWVSENIRYIGVAFGIGRFQPHSASAVLDNGYGDCKDKYTLLASMLLVLGLHPDAVLIGPGIRFNEAVPSPASFNHVITRVKVNGRDVWLDSTVGVLPYRLLIASARDKQALVVPMEGIANIDRTPANYPYPPYSSMKVVGALDNDLTSDSKITLTYRDDDEIAIRFVMQQVSAAQYNEFIQRFMQGMGFGGTVSEVEIDHADDPSQPLVISFHYHRVKEQSWGQDRITALFRFISLPAVDEKNPPVASIQLGTPRTETDDVEMKLPPGWTAQLPDPVHARTPYVTCDVAYRLKHGMLYGERRLIVFQEKVPVPQWKQYTSWYDNAGAGGVPYIQLKHTHMLLPGVDPASIHPATP